MGVTSDNKFLSCWVTAGFSMFFFFILSCMDNLSTVDI